LFRIMNAIIESRPKALASFIEEDFERA
jgi:hypothetical protein